jgi:hypothetical protein
MEWEAYIAGEGFVGWVDADTETEAIQEAAYLYCDEVENVKVQKVE